MRPLHPGHACGRSAMPSGGKAVGELGFDCHWSSQSPDRKRLIQLPFLWVPRKEAFEWEKSYSSNDTADRVLCIYISLFCPSLCNYSLCLKLHIILHFNTLFSEVTALVCSVLGHIPSIYFCLGQSQWRPSHFEPIAWFRNLFSVFL